jgi:hypothetical protein
MCVVSTYIQNYKRENRKIQVCLTPENVCRGNDCKRDYIRGYELVELLITGTSNDGESAEEDDLIVAFHQLALGFEKSEAESGIEVDSEDPLSSE